MISVGEKIELKVYVNHDDFVSDIQTPSQSWFLLCFLHELLSSTSYSLCSGVNEHYFFAIIDWLITRNRLTWQYKLSNADSQTTYTNSWRPRAGHCTNGRSIRIGTRVKVSHLVASLPTGRQQVVFAWLVPICQQVWNNLSTVVTTLLILSYLLQGCSNKSDTVMI
jgi:hypothetical protein